VYPRPSTSLDQSVALLTERRLEHVLARSPGFVGHGPSIIGGMY